MENHVFCGGCAGQGWTRTSFNEHEQTFKPNMVSNTTSVQTEHRTKHRTSTPNTNTEHRTTEHRTLTGRVAWPAGCRWLAGWPTRRPAGWPTGWLAVAGWLAGSAWIWLALGLAGSAPPTGSLWTWLAASGCLRHNSGWRGFSEADSGCARVRNVRNAMKTLRARLKT